MDDTTLARTTATALLGIDTLWGGDVMNPSGTGRFIADSWFSDEPLPAAYTHPAAARLRQTGGIAAKSPDVAAIDAYLADIHVRSAIDALVGAAAGVGGLRGAFLSGLAMSCSTMLGLVEELLGRGPAVPYEAAVIASTGKPPEPSDPHHKRHLVAELLGKAGYPSGSPQQLLEAVDRWRGERLVPRKSIRLLADALIALLETGTREHVVRHLPPSLRDVPRANIRFLPIEDAWFSGSMNYVGRARTADGQPEYEATYEINAALQIAVPEFAQLVSHEVVPGHVTTFALAQALYVQRQLHFEATVLSMNTRFATLSEGIANNAILMAFGVTEVADLPDDDMKIGTLLALLQDDAKNQSSYLTWGQKVAQPEVARTLRRDFLVSEERADKLSGAWGRHPLLGRMYLPAYRAGTEKVAQLRRRYPAELIIPTLYGVHGLVDVVTIDHALQRAL